MTTTRKPFQYNVLDAVMVMVWVMVRGEGDEHVGGYTPF